MGVDLRQVVAGILTITMFVMLGNMIKREHFDPPNEKLPGLSDEARYEDISASEKGLVSVSRSSNAGPWKEEVQELKPCWEKPESAEDVGDSKGSISFSLVNGPEYHVSQISAAVVVAKYLGATLVIPDIRGTNPGDKRSFGDIYDVDKFTRSLDGVVTVSQEQPSSGDIEVVKVPSRVNEDYIVDNIEPVFKSKGNIRLATYFPSVNMRKKKSQKSDLDPVACLAMFGSLELQPEVGEVVDSMVERLRTLSRKANGQFLAVDLRLEMLEKKNCQGGSKKCFDAQAIADFLQKVGFNRDTTIYVTQSKWDSSLDALKEAFPKIYTKESIMPVDKKGKFLGDSEFEKVIDFYVCSESDVFVPAISGLFYANVAGRRIANGKTQILVPAVIEETVSASATDYLSPYVVKKNHFAYSCYC